MPKIILHALMSSLSKDWNSLDKHYSQGKLKVFRESVYAKVLLLGKVDKGKLEVKSISSLI